MLTAALENVKNQCHNFSQLSLLHVNLTICQEYFVQNCLKTGLFLTQPIPLGTYSFCRF